MDDQEISGNEPSHPDPPPPPPPPPASPASGASPPPADSTAAGQSNNFQDFRADTANFLAVEKQIIQMYQARAALRHFTCEDAEPVSETWEDESERSFRAADEEIDHLLRHLDERRVLLLDAARGAGRVMAAISLGRRLRKRAGWKLPTLLVQSLDRQVRLDVRRLASGDSALRDRLVIFRDSLGRVAHADHAAWRQLAEQLRDRNAFIVFITDYGSVAADHPAAAHGMRHQLSLHPPTLLEAELDRQLARLEGRESLAPEVLAALRGKRAWLLETFAYAPQLAEFVGLYANMNLPELKLDEAWRRFHDPGGRLLREADGDLDAWSAIFALALAQCVRDARGARWVEFDGLHRRAREWLHADLHWRWPYGSAPDDANEAPSDFSDEPLLKAAHAEEFVDATTLACMVRFRNGVPPEQLWRALLHDHRRALVTAIPRLREMAEEGTSLSILAARILGRVGEMDPDRVVGPLVKRWLYGDQGRHHGLLGPLFEGILGSENEQYRTLLLRHLRVVGRGTAADDERLAAVVAAYSWIGDFELARAMRELGMLAREHLAPMIAEGQEAERLLVRVDQYIEGTNSARTELDLRSFRERLLAWAQHLYNAKAHAFTALRLTLNSLCATRGPVPVLVELRKWIAEEGWRMGVLVALLFFQENGIADDLRASKVQTDGHGDPAQASCNPLVVWMSEGENEVRQVARFLGDLFESLSTRFVVGHTLQRICGESFDEHLTDWVRDALPVPQHASTLKSLVESLARVSDGMLRERLRNLLGKPVFARDDPRMRAFAASIRL